jgi:ankyrin repeat protein
MPPSFLIEDLPPLHSASRSGDVEGVKTALKRAVISERDTWGETAMHWARTVEVATVLVAAGGDINTADPTGVSDPLLAVTFTIIMKSPQDTPLHWAAENGSAPLISFYVGRGVDINKPNRYRGRYCDTVHQGYVAFIFRHQLSRAHPPMKLVAHETCFGQAPMD